MDVARRSKGKSVAAQFRGEWGVQGKFYSLNDMLQNPARYPFLGVLPENLTRQIVIDRFLSQSENGGTLNVNLSESASWAFTGAESPDIAKSVFVTSLGPIRISNGWFDEVVIQPSGEREISISNSHIRKLVFPDDGSLDGLATIQLTNCWVERLCLGRGAVVDFAYEGGGVLNIICPVPGENNPFRGSAAFSNVFLPRTCEGFPIKGAQPYRNMRYHLAQLQNGPAASLFHSAELAIERDNESGLNWLFNLLYGEFSDYGASPVLPLAWLGLLWLMTSAILFATGVAFDEGQEAFGWQKYLQQADLWGDLLRAVIVGFQPISWLGALISPGQSIAMVPNCFLAQIWLVIDGILSTVLLALFIFALRRRFKLTA